jgi:hypothetical protein
MSELVLTNQANPGALGANLVAIFVNTLGQPSYVGNDGIPHVLSSDGADAAYANLSVTIDLSLAHEIAANVGAVTMNTPSGRVTAANSAANIVVTNSLVTANSRVMAWASTNDANGRVNSVVPAAGNFTVYMTPPDSNMSIDFVVFN